ncbi:MAG TPA: hypothetical protein VF721_11970 [Pyrinomonadaceae bacterium]|jgi:hypothetical protein
MKLIFQICLLIVFFLTASEIAYSCTCVYFEHKEEIKKTDVIFTGKVIEIIEDTSHAPAKIENVSPGVQRQFETRKRYLVKLKVETGFKGVTGDGEITLVQYEYEKPVPCGGLLFVKGKKYLVYASKYKDELSGDDGCSRTREFDKKSKDYRELLQLRLKSKSKELS